LPRHKHIPHHLLVWFLLRLIISICHNACSIISMSNVAKDFKYAPKHDFNSNYIQGTTWSVIWRKLNSSHHPIQRLVVPSSTQTTLLFTFARGKNGGGNLNSGGRTGFSSTPKLIRLGAISSAEDTPPSLASSPTDLLCLLVEALGFGTSSSLLETSTSMLALG
jgi:hypothetical protein